MHILQKQEVLDYSQTLKQSVAQRTAMQKAMKAAKTAFFPAVDATGSYQYRINKYEMDFGGMAVPMEHDSYSAEVGVSQPIYAGGSIYHNYKASQIQTQMADKSVDLTTDNIIYAAEAVIGEQPHKKKCMKRCASMCRLLSS